MASWGDEPSPDRGAAYLEKLAAELGSGQFAVSLVTSAGVPYLAVSSRAAPDLSEKIRAQSGYYWWSWAERIAPVWNVAQAAEAVRRVLRTVGDSR